MDAHPDLVGGSRRLQAVDRRAARLRTSALRVATARTVTVSGTASVRLHRPPRATGPRPALLWVHGGGYVSGRAWHDDAMCRRWSRALGIVVAAVDYRLAPADPYPAALQDCTDALAWLASHPSVDASRLAVGGASAGAGLAAALALGRADLALQLLVYPMLDDRTVLHPPAHVPAWEVSALTDAWSAYLGVPAGSCGVPVTAAVGRATDVRGCAPAWLGVGTRDAFHDEAIAYAASLREAGVPCALSVVPGAGHGFDVLHPRAGVSRAFVAEQDDALRAALLR